tara:strand:+ start:3808 stop:4824 length:1017 start_codon:yes stop_codon:yes gene_type:complete
MPEVGGKKYPYTKAGIKAAAAARKKLESDDSFRLSPPKSSENLQASLQKIVKNPAPHRPRTDNAVPRSANPQPTGTTIDGSSEAMGDVGGAKPRGPKRASVKSLEKFWFGIQKAPTSEENARKLNEVLEQEKREREEIQSGTEQGMRSAGMPEDEITRQRPGVRLSSRVSAPSNMYTSDEAYRSDPDFEAASGGTEFGRDRLSNVISEAGKQSTIENEKYKYGDWDKPGESSIQNLYKAFGLMKDHLPVPPRQGEVWDPVKHRWVKPENAGRTVAEVQGEKRIRGSGVGAHERALSGKQPLTSRRFFARGTKGVVSRRGTPSKRTARAARSPRARRSS